MLDAPQTIYNRPTNLFVAGFIGSPAMNFLQGATVDGGKAFDFNGLKIDLADYDGGAVLERSKAILGLRPEHLTLQSTEEPGKTIPATVEIDEPMGADTLVWLEAMGTKISVRVATERRRISDPVTTDRRLQAGNKVFLKVDISAASIFDATTEQRV